jgi:hypothetical protein
LVSEQFVDRILSSKILRVEKFGAGGLPALRCMCVIISAKQNNIHALSRNADDAETIDVQGEIVCSNSDMDAWRAALQIP